MVWLITIAIMDLRIRKVSNWMVLLGLATGTAALFSGVQPFWVEPVGALIGMVVAFAALLPFYAIRWMGAGDVKFAAVIGLWFGLSPYLLAILLGGSILAGLHGLIIVTWRAFKKSPTGYWIRAHIPVVQKSIFAHAETNVHSQSETPIRIKRSIPYAGYLALCSIWVVIKIGPPLSI